MSNKHISYLAKNFDDFKNELLKFTREYYPELAENFNDASVGSWILDLYSAIGDDLSFHIDRTYQNTNINSTSSLNAVMNIARSNGLKVPGIKPGMCELEFTCNLPVISVNGNLQPDFNYAPILKSTTNVFAGEYKFELTEDVNFAEQFNSNNYSNRKYKPVIGSNGNIINYEVSKSVIATNVSSKVFKKTLLASEIKPFFEVILPDTNVTCVKSIIFKETSSYKLTPDINEYFIDEEVFKLSKESVFTRRYFEVDSLSEQYVFGNKRDSNGEIYEEYNDSDGTAISRIYKGKWNGIKQKFITEYTDNGYLKIIFGAGSEYNNLEETNTPGSSLMTKIVNNEMLGELPKAGWTMFILYQVSNGQSANLGIGAINSISTSNIDMPINANNETYKREVISSLKVKNISNVIGGKNFPSVEEIKNLIKYNSGAQKRCVVLNDYKSMVQQMPGKYGSPFRVACKEENNKVVLSLLNVDSKGKLDSSLPNMMAQNIEEYLSMYKNIGDFVAIRSGKIYNIGVEVDVYIDKNYDNNQIIGAIINEVKKYFDITKHDIGGDIFIGDLEKKITSIEGVISIIDLSIYNLYSNRYSDDISPLYREKFDINKCEGSDNEIPFVNTQNGKSFKIDLKELDNILYNDDDSMFEIKYPNIDIVVKAKTK